MSIKSTSDAESELSHLDFDFDDSLMEDSFADIGSIFSFTTRISDNAVSLLSRQINRISKNNVPADRRLLKKLTEKQSVLLVDKISFVLGVTYIWLTTVVMAKFPHLMSLYYSALIVPLVMWRWRVYKLKKHHYFLADLCYFANLLLMVNIFLAPASKVVFVSVFGLINGPVCWAIYAWRNALVFHSVDKMTSIVIHFSGALTLYCIRWLLVPDSTQFLASSYPNITYDPQLPNLSFSISFLEFITIPMLTYLVWQVTYCYLILDLRRDKVNDGTHATSFSWLKSDFLKKNKDESSITKLMHWCGEKHFLKFFMFSQFLFTFVCILPVWLFYNYFWIHTVCLS